MLADAIAFSAEAHKSQKDKNGEVYFFHPIRVALALKAHGYSENHQAVGVLHDTVEDTDAALEDIYELFGVLIGDAVRAITRDKDDSSGEWRETYKEYIGRCCEDLIARIVKRFDVYDNFDPRRYCEGVPIGRYIWTLDYLDQLEKLAAVGGEV